MNRRGFVPVLNRPAARRLSTLAAPTGLTTYNAATAIGLTWSPAAGPVVYSLERSPDGVTGWAVIATPTGAYYSDTLLAPGSVYFYRVRVLAGAALGPYSSVVSGAALAGSPAAILWAEDAWSATSGGMLVTADNADVLRLRDRSGNGRDFTAVTAGQKASLQTNEINGRPIIRTAGTASFFQATRYLVPNDFHLSAFAKPAAANATRILCGDDNTSNKYFNNYPNTGHITFFDGTAASSTAVQQSNAAYALNASNRYLVGATPTWKCWKNGIVSGSTPIAVSGGTQGLARLFNRQTGVAAEGWSGDLAYLHLWPNDATNANPLAVSQVGAWVASYYAQALDCLGAPASFAATATGPTEVTLTWTHVTGATSYRVWQATAPCNEPQTPADFQVAGTVNAGQEAGNPASYVAEELTTGQRYWFILQAVDTNGSGGLASAEATAVPTALPATLVSGYNCDLDAASVTSDAAGAIPATTNGAVVQRFNEGSALGNAVSTGGAAGQATLKVYPDGRRAVIANGTSTQFDVAGGRTYTDFHLYLVGTSLDTNIATAAVRVLLGDKVASRFLLRFKNSEAQFYDGTATYNADNAVQLRLRSLIEIERSGTQLRVWANHKQQGPTLTVPATGVTFDALFALNSASYSFFELTRLVIYPGAHTLAQRAQNWSYFEAQYQFLDGRDSYNRIPQTTHLGFNYWPMPLLLANGDRLCARADSSTTEGADLRAWWMRSKSGGHGFIPVHNYKNATKPSNPNMMLQLPPGHPVHPNRIISNIYDTSPPEIRMIYSDAGGDPGSWVMGAIHAPPAGYTYWIPDGLQFLLDTDNATVLLPAYGLKTATGRQDTLLMQSVDGGDTYTLRSVIAAGAGGVDMSEATVTRTSGSNYLAVMRRDPPQQYAFCTSTDRGLTWTAPATFTPAGTELGITPFFLRLTVGPAAGHLWLFTCHRPAGVAAIRSTDNGANWAARRWVHQCALGGNPNNGNLSGFQRPDGLIEAYWYANILPLSTPNHRTEVWRTIIHPVEFWV